MKNKEIFKLHIQPIIPREGTPIGHFYRNNKINDYVMVIVVDTAYVKEKNMREVFVELPTEKQGLCYMVVTKKFAFKLQTKKSESIFIVYHELGHICCGFSENFTSQDDIKNARINAIKNGSVMKDELNADAFATQYIGKEKAIRALELLKNERIKFDKIHGFLNAPMSKLAVQEYCNRIIAIEKLDNI